MRCTPPSGSSVPTSLKFKRERHEVMLESIWEYHGVTGKDWSPERSLYEQCVPKGELRYIGPGSIVFKQSQPDKSFSRDLGGGSQKRPRDSLSMRVCLVWARTPISARSSKGISRNFVGPKNQEIIWWSELLNMNVTDLSFGGTGMVGDTDDVVGPTCLSAGATPGSTVHSERCRSPENMAIVSWNSVKEGKSTVPSNTSVDIVSELLPLSSDSPSSLTNDAEHSLRVIARSPVILDRIRSLSLHRSDPGLSLACIRKMWAFRTHGRMCLEAPASSSMRWMNFLDSLTVSNNRVREVEAHELQTRLNDSRVGLEGAATMIWSKIS